MKNLQIEDIQNQLTPEEQKCEFCPEFFKPNGYSTFKSLIQDENFRHRTLWKNQDFRIIVPIGPFKPGYLMIMTNKHISSFSYLPTRTLFQADSIIQDIISKILAPKYGPYIIFEHGAMNENLKGASCCSDHAHIHIIPYSRNIMSKVSSDIDFKKINNIGGIRDAVNLNKPYIYIQTINERFITFDGDIESQYLRQVIGTDEGITIDWDWRINHFKKIMTQTYFNLESEFKNYTHENL